MGILTHVFSRVKVYEGGDGKHDEKHRVGKSVDREVSVHFEQAGGDSGTDLRNVDVTLYDRGKESKEVGKRDEHACVEVARKNLSVYKTAKG
jgi:hypothetical protein